MTLKNKIMKLQTYKMYEGEDTVYVERNDVLKALEQQLRDCKTCKHSDNGNCAYTEECHECMWESKYEQQPYEDCISRAELLENAYLLTDDEGITHEVVHADDIKYATPMTWSGWTPATQPPEPNTALLLYVKYKSSGQRTYQLGMWNDNKQVWEDWRTPYQLEEEFEIIKWMELPEG